MLRNRTNGVLLGMALALLLVGATVPATAGAATRLPVIVGGQVATGSYPWIVSLQYSNGGIFCGGELITTLWVLTAGHCVDRDTTGEKARIGSTNRSAGGIVVAIVRGVRDPGYHTDAGVNDIGLLKLKQPIPNAHPIKLTNDTNWDGRTLRLYGWGQTCPTPDCDGGSTKLRQLDSVVLAPDRCPTHDVDSFDPAHDLCLAADPDHSPCFGDSGGPDVYLPTGRLVGVISRGAPNCGDAGELSTRVQPYLNWIYNTTH